MYSAMVLAAGIGSRMGLGYNKMLYEVKGAPVIIHTIKKFLNDETCGLFFKDSDKWFWQIQFFKSCFNLLPFIFLD